MDYENTYGVEVRKIIRGKRSGRMDGRGEREREREREKRNDKG